MADVANDGVAPFGPVASTVRGSDKESSGATVSVTVTVKRASPALPCVSVAVHTTGVGPTGKAEPDAGVQEIVATSSSGSVASGGVHVATAPLGDVASRVTGEGRPWISGAWSVSPITTGTTIVIAAW